MCTHRLMLGQLCGLSASSGPPQSTMLVSLSFSCSMATSMPGSIAAVLLDTGLDTVSESDALSPFSLEIYAVDGFDEGCCCKTVCQ